MRLSEFAPEGWDKDHGCDPNFYYDIPKLESVSRRLANASVNWGWYDLQLKVLVKYMKQCYGITAADLDEMFPTAPEIAYYIERNIIKRLPDGRANPNYKPRAPRPPKTGLNEFAPGGDFKPPAPPKKKGGDPWGNDDRSKILQAVRQLLQAGNKVDWKVPGQMGHVVRVSDDSVILKRWGKPYSKINYSLMMRDDRDDQYQIMLVKPGHYKVVSSDPNWQLEEEQLDELSFLGSPCTKDCSGHRAGYYWSAARGNKTANSWSQSFNNGASLRAAGK